MVGGTICPSSFSCSSYYIFSSVDEAEDHSEDRERHQLGYYHRPSKAS